MCADRLKTWSVISLGSLLQDLTTLLVKNAQSKVPWWSFELFKCPVTGSQGEGVSSSLSISHPQRAMRSPLSLPFSKPDKSNVLSCSLQGHSFQLFCLPLDTFKDLHIILNCEARPPLGMTSEMTISAEQLFLLGLLHPSMELTLLAAWAHGWLPLSCCQPAHPHPSL